MAINEKDFWTVKAKFSLKNTGEGGRKTGIISVLSKKTKAAQYGSASVRFRLGKKEFSLT
jgi:hypothetical protein